MSEFEKKEQETAQDQPVHVIPEAVERFEHDDPALKDYLTTHGYVVVKGVMNQENISVAKTKLWEFLKESAGMSYEDKSTWTNARFEDIGLPNNGIMCTGIGQTDFMWYMRLLPKVKSAFSLVHETDELLCSMDGGNIFFPWHRDESTNHMKTETGRPLFYLLLFLLSLFSVAHGTPIHSP